MADMTVTGLESKPRRTSQESKAENTTRIAREMIDAEVARRDAKTAKLRAARMEREALEREQAPAVAPKKAARKNPRPPAA